MKKALYQSFRHCSLLILCTILYLFSFAQGFSTQTEAKLQQVINSFQNNPDSPYIGGISVAINVDGLAIWQGATGFAARNVDAQNNLLPGGTPFTVDTLSRIYSVTKTFTAALVLELAKEGAFSLDEPVSKYLPLINAVNPGLNPNVTIHQLLAHESGYSDYTDEVDLQVAVAYDPTHIWTPYEMLSFVHQIAAPGAERRYSSTNYILLGAIIEAATGKSAEQHFRERFFNPLHLSSMYLAGRESIGNRGNLAAPHDNISVFNPVFSATGQPTFPDTTTNISRFPMDGIVSLAFTGGAIVSNVADEARWGNALFGGRATSQATIDTMVNSILPVPDEDGDYLGYGVFRTTRISETDTFIGHNGMAVGYKSIMFYQPERKMTIAVLTNFYGADPYAIGKALYEALPHFLCGNEKDNKVTVCFKSRTICLPRPAARLLIKAGAYLGGCESTRPELITKSANVLNSKVLENDKLTVSPNPFNNNTVASFTAASRSKANLSLYDLNGKQVAVLFNGVIEKGIPVQVKIEGDNLPAGVYICRLQTASGISRQKLVLRK